MFDTLPISAVVREMLTRATRSAHLLSSSHIDPVHLLHSMASLDKGIAIEILTEYGIDPLKIQFCVERAGKVNLQPLGEIKLPMGVSSQEVLKAAIQNHQLSGRTTVLTGDILVGMLTDGRNSAAKILHRFGITVSYLADIQDEVTAKYEFNKEE